MKIPMTLDSAFIDRLRIRNADGDQISDPALEGLSRAMSEARSAAEKIEALAEALAHNLAETPQANAAKLAQQAMQISEKIAPKLDDARAKAARDLEAVERATRCPPPPQDALAMQLESELRQRLATMPPKDRSELIAASIKTGDDAVAAAVLRGHPALAGMRQSEQDLTRESWRRSRHPGEVDRMDRLRRAIEAVDRAGGSLIGMVKQATEAPAAQAAAVASERVKEAVAAAAE